MTRQGAGKYPETVELQRETLGAKDAHGKKVKTFTPYASSAARLWETSAIERASQPAESVSRNTRLELRWSSQVVLVNDRLIWRGVTYRISESELRLPENILVTIVPV